jgi:hypothetical protein
MKVASIILSLLAGTAVSGSIVPPIMAAEVKTPGPPPTPRLAAQFDITGHWVSIVSEDWMYRMLVAPKGDTGSIPVNDAGKAAADAWDPARDAGSCKAYGAAGIIRRPGRLNVVWADDRTLRIDFDAGLKTRMLHFSDRLPASGYDTSEPPSNFVVPGEVGQPTAEGYSVAAWHRQGQSRGMGPMQSHTVAAHGGSLAAITQNMSPGYLQSNGVPYSGGAILREFYDIVDLPGDVQLLVVTSIVEDPAYLIQPYVTATIFKRERDGSRWDPQPC